MTRITAKGYEFNEMLIRDSYDRRAVSFMNIIISSLKKIGVKEDDINVEVRPVARMKAPASASWYFDGYHMYFSYKKANKFVENLYVISKVIELEIKALQNDEITLQDFINKFSEEHDTEKIREEARELLGVDKESLDLDEINRKYKLLAKKYHPDVDGGNAEMFKRINHAHKY